MIVFGRMNLGSHLGGHARLLCRLCEATGFIDVVGKWFFAVDVFAELQCWHRGVCMCVLRSADDYSINVVPDVIVEFSKVLELFCFREFVSSTGQKSAVDITKAHNIDAFTLGDRFQVASSTPTCTNEGNFHPIIWTCKRHFRKGSHCGYGSSLGEEIATSGSRIYWWHHTLAWVGN